MDYTITITLNTDNLAFNETGFSLFAETVTVLEDLPQHIAEVIADHANGQKSLIDTFGNNVGQVITVINKPEQKQFWAYCEACETTTRIHQEDSALAEFPIQECSICGTQINKEG